MEGLEFFKPLGTGSGAGYSLWPDFSVYGLLAVWETEALARRFLASPLFAQFIERTQERYTIFLRPLSSRGSWSGFNSWSVSPPDKDNPLIAALTRATLKPRFLFRFWSLVPGVSASHKVAHGLIFTKGIGEIPLMEQATFSVWENLESMKAFAYKNEHAEAIRITRAKNGFREEMFTRLQPFDASGTWNGEDALKPYLGK
jgi:spheroidene monooxygenase